jgi:phosphoglycolate phosphatase
MSRPIPIIFDLDGTLIDSAPDIHAGLNTVLAAQGLPTLSLELVRSFIGHGVPHLIECALRHLEVDPHGPIRMPVTRSFETIYETSLTLTTIYPNVISALSDLVDAGHELGICTNKPMRPTLAILDHLDLRRYFTTIIGGDSLPVRKPDPAPLIKALWNLGDGGCLYVGDSEVDAATAFAARIPFALVTHGYLKRPASELNADYLFEDFSQLSPIVTKVNAINR